ncbi:MAG: secondary thiamine-phosphate synthase enzyme YjbQ [Myxococcales bacterium]
MRQVQRSFTVDTRGKGLYDVTQEVARVVAESDIGLGLATVFIAHTSASLLIQENADVEVQRDLERFFARLVPDGDPLFLHVEEGPDDMPAHVRAALTQTSIGIPLREGKLALGVWQGLYVFEHRNRPHQRKLIVHVVGE